MRVAGMIVLSFSALTALVVQGQEYGTFTDRRDSRTYKTIMIGTQIWMAENLTWKAPSDCWIYNNENIPTTAGYLYLWETAKKACPLGWRLPSSDEWDQLILYLGGDSIAGGKIKEQGIDNWQSPNSGATNQSGFNALPAGNRSSFDGVFYGKGKYTYWWSATEYRKTGEIYIKGVEYNTPRINRSLTNREFGYSIRCIKD